MTENTSPADRKSESPACSKAGDVYRCVVHLKLGSTVSTETTNPEAFIASLAGFMNKFHARGLFKSQTATVRLIGTPVVCIPIDNINFFTVQKKCP